MRFTPQNDYLRTGFTLVELSIVLVIIGLLIGGILVGQSMIDSAKTQKIIRELQQNQILVETFGSKYHFFPGDSPKISPAGNGDGFIYGAVSGQTGESIGAWTQLKNVGMLSINTSSPGSSYAPDGRWGIGFKDSTNTMYLLSAKTDTAYFMVTGGGANNGGLDYKFRPSNPMVKPMDAGAIDAKIDDGNPLLGSVMSTNFYGTGSNDGSYPGAFCILNTAGQYSPDRTKGTYNPNGGAVGNSTYSERTIASCAMIFEIVKTF